MRRYLLLAVIGLIQGCAAAGWRSPAAPSVPREAVEARKFVLVDANSKPIAELGAAQGGSGLVLMDSSGKPRAAMVLTEAGEPGLKLYDRDGVVRTALVLSNDGRCGLAIYDGRGKDRAALATNPNGAPVLLLFDRDGHLTTLLPAPPPTTAAPALPAAPHRHPGRARSH